MSHSEQQKLRIKWYNIGYAQGIAGEHKQYPEALKAYYLRDKVWLKKYFDDGFNLGRQRYKKLNPKIGFWKRLWNKL